MLNIDYNVTFFGEKKFLEIQYLIIGAMSYKVLAAFILSFPATVLSNCVSKNVFFLKPNMNQETHLLTELKNAILFR